MKANVLVAGMCLSVMSSGFAFAGSCEIDGLEDDSILEQLGMPGDDGVICLGEPGTFNVPDDGLSSLKVKSSSVKSRPMCAVPISATLSKGFRSVGLAEFFVAKAGDETASCSFSYIGDGKLLTAGHCLWNGGIWRTPVNGKIQIGFGSETVFDGCKATQFCVPRKWKESKSKAHDLGLIRVSGCGFDNDEPTPLAVRALPIDEIEQIEKVRFTGYYPRQEIKKYTCFFNPTERMWTSNQQSRGVQANGDGEGLLCHDNPTIKGTSGSPITDEARDFVYCVHSYRTEDDTDCGSNACTIITEQDENALTGNPEDWDYVCQDL